jgi:signal transduction histidine kinase
VELVVSDNGVGFDLSGKKQNGEEAVLKNIQSSVRRY